MRRPRWPVRRSDAKGEGAYRVAIALGHADVEELRAADHTRQRVPPRAGAAAPACRRAPPPPADSARPPRIPPGCRTGTPSARSASSRPPRRRYRSVRSPCPPHPSPGASRPACCARRRARSAPWQPRPRARSRRAARWRARSRETRRPRRRSDWGPGTGCRAGVPGTASRREDRVRGAARRRARAGGPAARTRARAAPRRCGRRPRAAACAGW